MTWVDLFLLFILACGVVAFSRKCLRKYTPIYKGIDRDFASHCALSIEESPLLQIQTAPEGALAQLSSSRHRDCMLSTRYCKLQLDSIHPNSPPCQPILVIT